MLIKLENEACRPTRAHATDAGADLYSMDDSYLMPGMQRMLETGVAVAIPQGMVGLLFNRSSQGKLGIQIPNSVGVIDSDYRGTIKVILRNMSDQIYHIHKYKTKICQLVIVPIWIPVFEEFEGTDDSWNNTARGTGGFGSTGV